MTLTSEEIRDLAQFCGMVLSEPTAQEKEDERETEIVIAPWPTKGVMGDNGKLPPHKHIAYFDEYPEEGCVPLGSPENMTTYYITFKADCGNFTDHSEGLNIRQAVERLGMKMSDVKSWKII